MDDEHKTVYVVIPSWDDHACTGVYANKELADKIPWAEAVIPVIMNQWRKEIEAGLSYWRAMTLLDSEDIDEVFPERMGPHPSNLPDRITEPTSKDFKPTFQCYIWAKDAADAMKKAKERWQAFKEASNE